MDYKVFPAKNTIKLISDNSSNNLAVKKNHEFNKANEAESRKWRRYISDTRVMTWYVPRHFNLRRIEKLIPMFIVRWKGWFLRAMHIVKSHRVLGLRYVMPEVLTDFFYTVKLIVLEYRSYQHEICPQIIAIERIEYSKEFMFGETKILNIFISNTDSSNCILSWKTKSNNYILI